jgi:hypothetical protein
MSNMNRSLRLERMEQRECPSAGPLTAPAAVNLPQAISTDIANLEAALTTAAQSFTAHSPLSTEIPNALMVLVDSAKVALDVRADTGAGFGGMLAPLVKTEIDQATVYYDSATGNTAGAKTSAANVQTDLSQLGTSLAGTQNAGLADQVFTQLETDFMNANDSLLPPVVATSSVQKP